MKSFLQHYRKVCTNEEPPNYLLTKKIPVTFSKFDSIDVLWQKHNQALKKTAENNYVSDQSLLDLKIELSQRMLSQCQFCEHRCNINRTINGGFCLVSKSRIASEFIHQNEESFFIPSHTIFFSGCTLKCIFCQNWEISHLQSGIQIPPYEFANRIHIRKQQGSKNVNWVGGDPTPNIPYILKTLQNLDDWIPQIWNSNMYCSIEAMILLDGVIDVYLADHKFGNDRCASQLSQSSSYVRTIQRNLQIAYEQADLFIRHLILPNHISCCSLPILHWLKEFLPFSPINIMKQYRPCYHARNHPTINRLVTTEEYDKVLSVARTLQLNVV